MKDFIIIIIKRKNIYNKKRNRKIVEKYIKQSTNNSNRKKEFNE